MADNLIYMYGPTGSRVRVKATLKDKMVEMGFRESVEKIGDPGITKTKES